MSEPATEKLLFAALALLLLLRDLLLLERLHTRVQYERKLYNRFSEERKQYCTVRALVPSFPNILLLDERLEQRFAHISVEQSKTLVVTA